MTRPSESTWDKSTWADASVIDTHVHVWQPDYLPAALRMSWAEHAAYRRPGPGRTPDELYQRVSQDIRDPQAEHLLSAMDTAGVDCALILGVDYGPTEWAATRVPTRSIMHSYDDVCRASGGRLAFAAGVHPHRADAVQLAQEYLALDACRGLKLYPPAGFLASDPVCEPVYGALADAGKTAVFHTAWTTGRLQWRNSWPLHITDVQARHPDLRIVLAHAGWPCWWDEAAAVAGSHARTYLEVSLWQAEALDAPAQFLPRLERAVRLCGADRILFASDTFYGPKQKGAGDWKRWVEFFRTLPLQTDGRITASQVAQMLFQNARDVYCGGASTSDPSASAGATGA